MHKKDSILRKIANTLYLNVQKVPDMGLLNGKLGIALFLYRYADYSGEEHYGEFGNEYISEMYDTLYNYPYSDFFEGLAGIGWTFQELIDRGYAEGNSDEILQQIDEKIKKTDFNSDLRSEFSLFSAGIYFLKRDKPEIIHSLLYKLNDFFADRTTALPLSYLNSALYFIIESYKSKIEEEICLKLFPVVMDKILFSFQQRKFFDTDLVTFHHNIEYLQNCGADLKINIPADNLNISKKTIMQSGWNNLLYSYPTLFGLTLMEINNYVDSTISNLRRKDLIIYGGLPGLGLELINTNY